MHSGTCSRVGDDHSASPYERRVAGSPSAYVIEESESIERVPEFRTVKHPDGWAVNGWHLNAGSTKAFGLSAHLYLDARVASGVSRNRF
jgi:hypothetical protein